MACSIMGCSCSMCPYCATEHCPSYGQKSDKYWIYVTNQKESCYIKLFSTNDRDSLIPKLEKIRKRKSWAKCYKERYKWNAETEKYNISFVDSVEITITKGEYGWYDAIRLELDTNTGDLIHRDKNNRKPWCGKIIFRKNR